MGLPDWPLPLIGSHVSPLLFQDGQTRWFPVRVNSDVLGCLAVSIAPAIYSHPIGGLHLRITWPADLSHDLPTCHVTALIRGADYDPSLDIYKRDALPRCDHYRFTQWRFSFDYNKKHGNNCWSGFQVKNDIFLDFFMKIPVPVPVRSGYRNVCSFRFRFRFRLKIPFRSGPRWDFAKGNTIIIQ